MKITIESDNIDLYTGDRVNKAVSSVEETDAMSVDDAIRLCENVLSAHFGYGIKIHDYETYTAHDRRKERDDGDDDT